MTASHTPAPSVSRLESLAGAVCSAHGCAHDWVIWSGKPRCRKCGATRR